MKLLLATSFLIVLTTVCATPVRPQSNGPMLLTEEKSGRAAAVDSVTRVRDPLPVVAQNNLSQDHRTRLALFGINMALLPGEDASAITAKARDSQSKNYDLIVEFVGKVPGLDFTQIIVRLPDELAQAGDVWVSVSLRGQTSNEVVFNVAVQSEPRTVTLVARRVINGSDTYVDACYSFEFGTNGEGSLSLTRNDWDILFGNRPDIDTFAVTTVVDDRSRIQDLGALNWNDTFQVPVLTPHPVPTNEPDTNVVIGHMYVVHTKDSDSDLYALFRVEALEPRKSVTISWKSVRSP